MIMSFVVFGSISASTLVQPQTSAMDSKKQKARFCHHYHALNKLIAQYNCAEGNLLASLSRRFSAKFHKLVSDVRESNIQFSLPVDIWENVRSFLDQHGREVNCNLPTLEQLIESQRIKLVS